MKLLTGLHAQVSICYFLRRSCQERPRLAMACQVKGQSKSIWILILASSARSSLMCATQVMSALLEESMRREWSDTMGRGGGWTSSCASGDPLYSYFRMRRSLKRDKSGDFEVVDDEQDTLRGKIESLQKNQVNLRRKHRMMTRQNRVEKKFTEHKQKSRTQINSTPLHVNRQLSSSSSDVYDIVEIEEDSQNLQSSIMTKYKHSFFNEKIKRFNEAKQKFVLPLSERCSRKTSLHKQFSNLRSDQLPYGMNDSIKSKKKSSSKIDELFQVDMHKMSKDSSSLLKLNKESSSVHGNFGSVVSLRQPIAPNVSKQISLMQNRTSLDLMSGGFFQQQHRDQSQHKSKNLSVDESNYTIDLPLQESISQANTIPDEIIHKRLVEFIYTKNVAALNSLLIQLSKEYKNDLLNVMDHHGNTPLFLAVKLSYSSNQYFEIVKLLLIHGADPIIGDHNGWSPIEEAIAQSDILLASLLLDYIIKRKERELQNHRVIVNQHLMGIQDFYLEMKWEFTSSYIPFLSKLAPSDVFKLTKKGTSLRLDSTFAGLKNYRAKRRKMTLLYNPLTKDKQRQENQCHCRFIVMLNHTKNIYFYPIQEIDSEEKKQILVDLLNCESVKGRMRILECKIEESKNLLGNPVISTVNGWKSRKYNLKIESEKVFQKKSHHALNKTYEEYMDKRESVYSIIYINPLEEDEMISRVHNTLGLDQQLQKSTQFTQNPKQQNQRKLRWIHYLLGCKSRDSYVYISQDYPLRFQQFLPILTLLGQGNELISQLEVILQQEKIKNLLLEKGFPVKIEIPIGWAVEAVITFEKYVKLDNDVEMNDRFWIDEHLKYEDRRIAQKTNQREMKRLMLANLYI